MTGGNESGAQSESLIFPNPSRSYNESDGGVHFWGYDRTFEIAFFVDRATLAKISPGANADEAGLLDAFDQHRARIREAAGRAYAQRRKAAYVYSYRLTDSDF